MLIALGSWRGSPGVTTSALALAEVWPGKRRVYVAECDPRGGTLAARFLMPGIRRLLALAGDARNSDDLELLGKHADTTPSGTRCLTGPEDGMQLLAALSKLTTPGGLFEAAADEPDTVLLADCGRLEPDAPEIRSLLLLADLLVLVMRPISEHALHLSGVRQQIVKLHPNTGLLLVGEGNPAEQVSELLSLPVFGHLPSIPSQPAARWIERARDGFGPSKFSQAVVAAASDIERAAQDTRVGAGSMA